MSVMDRTNAPDEYWSTARVAELLDVPESTCRYWRFQNTGPRSMRFGRHVRYAREDVLAWIEQQKIAS